jgi:hypothetical protein
VHTDVSEKAVNVLFYTICQAARSIQYCTCIVIKEK